VAERPSLSGWANKLIAAAAVAVATALLLLDDAKIDDHNLRRRELGKRMRFL